MRPDDERECAEYLRASLPRLHRTAYLLCGDATEADDVEGYVRRVLVRKYLDTGRLGWARVLLTDRALDRPAPPVQSTVEDRQASRGLAALRELIGRGAANAAGRP